MWKEAKLPEFFNKKGQKNTPAWLTYTCHLEYTAHAPSWKRAVNFMANYHENTRHWTTWQKVISKWPQWVWDAIESANAKRGMCEMAAIDGTTVS